MRFICVLLCLSLFSSIVLCKYDKPCQTLENRTGRCIKLTECEPYYKIILEYKTNPARAMQLRQVHCGREGNAIKVCCPLSTVQSPVSKTTATQAPAPSENGRPHGDFVAAFPEPPECGSTNATFTRVVGGVPAKLGTFPWMAILGEKNEINNEINWRCGGSIITVRHILTAAHCIREPLDVVRVGELDFASDNDGATPEDIIVKTKIIHEMYSAKSYINDIGVVVLEKDITFTELIKPICLPKDSQLRSQNFEKYLPFVARWGRIQHNGRTSSHLQVAQLPVVSNKDCKQAYWQYSNEVTIDNKVMCAGKKGRDSCNGDSGGPLMLPIQNPQTYKFYFYQVGVVSIGRICAEEGSPSVNSRVTHFIPWIQEKVLGYA